MPQPPPPLPSKKNKSNQTLIIVLGVIGAVVLVGGSLFAAILIPTVGRVRETARRTVDASNARQIVQASLIHAYENEGKLPTFDESARSVHGVAANLARGGGTNDASIWFAMKSPAAAAGGAVLNDARDAVLPTFAAQQEFAWDYATGLTTSMHAATPVVWTRGLRPDGTWGSEGVYGTDGGYIGFLGGSISFFPNLESAPLVRTDGTRTSNILEALPSTARVVGAGPGTLNGSAGLGR